jgi:hypothetical protein
LVTGEFVTINNERYYAIKNVDQMEPFLSPWCQLPIVYCMNNAKRSMGSIVNNDQHTLCIDGLSVDAEHIGELFKRTGTTSRIMVDFDTSALFDA